MWTLSHRRTGEGRRDTVKQGPPTIGKERRRATITTFDELAVHPQHNGARLFEHLLSDLDVCPFIVPQTRIPRDVLVPLPDVFGMLTPLVLDDNAPFPIEQVDAGDEHRSIEEVSVDLRQRKASEDQQGTRFRFLERSRTGVQEASYPDGRPGTGTPTVVSGRFKQFTEGHVLAME